MALGGRRHGRLACGPARGDRGGQLFTACAREQVETLPTTAPRSPLVVVCTDRDRRELQRLRAGVCSVSPGEECGLPNPHAPTLAPPQGMRNVSELRDAELLAYLLQQKYG